MRTLSTNRPVALPKPFPGCWKRKSFIRRYQSAWMGLRRDDDVHRLAELARQRAFRKTKRGKKTNTRATRRWKKKHSRRVATGNRRWHLRNRVRRCHFCGKRGKSGRGALQRIARMLPDLTGRLVQREVDYCGSC
jgi:hypothetical protein